MASTARESLHELTSDYFHGLIPFEAYRQRRGQLLDDAVLSQGDSAARLPIAATENTEQQRPKPMPALEPKAADTAPAQWTRVYTLGAGAAIAFALGLAAFLVLMPRDETPREIASAAPQVVKAPTTVESPAPGAFIDRFVEADMWTEESLSAFLFDWDQLADADRGAVRESESFRALTEGLRTRLLELRALADPSEQASVDRFRLVATFARELDVDTGVSDLDLRRPPTEGSRTADIADTDEQAPEPAASTTARAAEDPAEAPPAVAKTSKPAVAATTSIPAAPSADVAPTVVSSAKAARPQATPRELDSPAQSPVPAPAAPARASADQGEARVANTPAAADSTATDQPEDALPVVGTAPAAATPVASTPAAANRPCRKEIAAVPVASRRTCYDVFDGARGPLMTVIPPSSFTMGSAEDKAASPAHQVTIETPFALAVYETTVGELRRFCVETSRSCAMLTADDDYPAVGMTWQDAADYASWLSTRTGAEYRLPSEAEWEYAARAGTSTRYPFGDEINQAQAVFAAGNVTAPLPKSRSVVANEFGLRHMVGNVREWVADVWAMGYADAPNDGRARAAGGDLRVARGGSFGDSKSEVTSAARRGSDPQKGDTQTGFRVLREL